MKHYVALLLVFTTGCDALFGRSITPNEIKDGTCALLEAARLACQLAELAGKPCAFTPPGCSAFEKAEEAKARRARDLPGDVLAGPDDLEPCRPSTSGSARPMEPPPPPASSGRPPLPLQ